MCENLEENTLILSRFEGFIFYFSSWYGILSSARTNFRNGVIRSRGKGKLYLSIMYVFCYVHRTFNVLLEDLQLTKHMERKEVSLQPDPNSLSLLFS